MGKRIFTAEQELAINTRDKTLLVSAAAGSGKTATLTERIIRSITDTENPISINEMLIVTFTNAAVSELKERIGKALREKLLENPESQHLTRQINMLPSARISTIDSFCNDILKNNAERFGISPKYRIADPIEASLISRATLSSLIEAGYEGKLSISREAFEELSSCLTGVKSESGLEDTILYLYERSKSHKDGVGIFHKFLKNFKFSYDNIDSNIYVKYAVDSLMALASHYSEMCRALANDCFTDDHGAHRIKSVLLETKEMLDEILKTTKYDKLYLLISKELPSLPVGGSKTPYRETASALMKELRDDIKSLREKFFDFAPASWEKSLLKLTSLTALLTIFVDIFDKAYFEEKRRRGILEYSDIERLAYLCLYDENGNLTELAKAFRNEFKAVYIDEYQDVNSLQNEIFDAISKSDNRFMVGDIKQSIYGFRGSDPTIFAKMKDSYPSDKTESSDNMSIFMSKNFRCDDGIIDFVNDIFDKMFMLNGKSIGYVPEDRLTAGKEKDKYYEARVPEIRLFSEEDIPDGDEGEDVEKSSLAPEWVAKKIDELIKSERLNSGEPIRPSDIAIIMRNNSGRSKVYADALKKYGIEAKLPDDKSFFLSAEVQLALCLLKSIDNPKRDVYLTAIMLSPLFDFSADELYRIKKHGNRTSVFESLKAYNEANPDYEKGQKFIKTLIRYREIAEGMRTDALILRLYNETGLLALAGKNGAKENLLLLYNYARTFESSSFEGLYNFIDYLNTVIESGAEFSQNAEEVSDAVTILTAHKSKGLEFPVVFIADVGSSLVSTNERRERIAFSDDFGFAMRPRADGGLALANSPVYNAIIEHNVDKRLEEELRIYYVALTRARERLFITGAIKHKSKEKYLDYIYLKKAFTTPYSLKKIKSFVDILHITPHKAKIVWGKDENAEASLPVLNFTAAKEENTHLTFPSESTLFKRFSFDYPRSHLTSLPEKMSISRLYPTVLDGTDDEALISLDKAPFEIGRFDYFADFLSDKKYDNAAKAGTATHVFLQFCNLNNMKALGAEAELERLVRENFISDSNASLVRMNEIKLFEASNLLSDMLNAKKLYREFRISVMLPAKLFTSDERKKLALEGHNVLLQGVIDCLYEDSNGDLHLVDYKTDRLNKAELADKSLAKKALSEKHSLQLSYYALAVERIFGRMPKSTKVYSVPLGDTVNIDLII